MRKFSVGLVVVVGLSMLAACNQNNRAPGMHGRHERGIFGERHEHGISGEERRGGRGRLRQACADDITKYCSGMDRPRLERRCLQGHLDQLSADCKTAVQNFGGGRRRRDSQ